MRTMESALRAEGYTVVNAGYPSRTAGVDDLADLAVGGALANPQLESSQRVHFVTHSLGGILVRSYLERHACPELGRVVMLGPPNQGSEVVDVLRHWPVFRWINGPAGAELGTGPGSAAARLGAVDFELGVIAGSRSVNWINSAIIPAADDGKVSIVRTRIEGMKDHAVIPATHPFLMKNRQGIGLTLRFLKSGSFSG